MGVSPIRPGVSHSVCDVFPQLPYPTSPAPPPPQQIVIDTNSTFYFTGEQTDYTSARAFIVMAILLLWGVLAVQVLAFIRKVKARLALLIALGATAVSGTHVGMWWW